MIVQSSGQSYPVVFVLAFTWRIKDFRIIELASLFDLHFFAFFILAFLFELGT